MYAENRFTHMYRCRLSLYMSSLQTLGKAVDSGKRQLNEVSFHVSLMDGKLITPHGEVFSLNEIVLCRLSRVKGKYGKSMWI